ncbi:MAG: M48 family metalloprotease [Blastocatellales bacterium]
MKNNFMMVRGILAVSLAATLGLAQLTAIAQGTRIQMPKNKYSLQQDVQLGRQAAAEVEKQMPIMPENSEVDRYVESVGRRLVAAIPREYQQSAFQYEFDVVNASDINAFALPGGPMYVNRGMIEAARNEGEMAGVMAHELSHVVLRHGTAQATKAQSAKFQLPAIGGAILGAIIGGNVGSIIAQGTQLGVSAYFLKYSREYERQADLLGAQIMARAGYDPRDLANMFRTIEREGGGSGPEWLSSHPNPGNRYEAITQEAERLRVNRSAARYDTAEFNRVKNELRRMSPAPTMQQIAQQSARNQQSNERPYPSGSRIERSVERPSSRYSTYSVGNVFRISVPENWQRFESQASVTFAPRGAYGDYQGQSVFTHGAIAGVVNAGTGNLEEASNRYVGSLLQNNSYLNPQGRYNRSSIDGQRALSIRLAGRSPVTGQTEVVTVHTTMLRNGTLFYIINVAPSGEYGLYNRAFSTMLRSVQLNG